MWFLDVHMDGGEDDLEFIRNINKVCSRGDLKKGSTSSSSSRSPTKALLKSFLHDLSFWEAQASTAAGGSSHSSHDKKQRGKRRLYTKTSSSLSGRSKRSSHSSSRHDGSDSSSKPVWKSAVDPATGRVYYYDAITRITQWNKVRQKYSWTTKQKQ